MTTSFVNSLLERHSIISKELPKATDIIIVQFTDNSSIMLNKLFLKNSLFYELFTGVLNKSDGQPKLMKLILNYLMCDDVCTKLKSLSLEEVVELHCLAESNKLLEYSDFIKNYMLKNFCDPKYAYEIAKLDRKKYRIMHAGLLDVCCQRYKVCFSKDLSIFSCANQVTLDQPNCCHHNNNTYKYKCLAPGYDNMLCCVHSRDKERLLKVLNEETEIYEKHKRMLFREYEELPETIKKKLFYKST